MKYKLYWKRSKNIRVFVLLNEISFIAVQLNLPDEMPALFSAGYSPITAAGTQAQIQHVARLLSSQLTAGGVGPGVEQVKEDEVST